MPKLQSSEVLDEVKKAIANHLGVSLDSIKESSKLVDDLGADSLDLVELTMDLEEKFGIKIPDEDISKLTDVKSVVDYIVSKQ
ncbi:acyl carrier protein [Athalassotoga saccharophila]|uniref:acyl carrier protein n=1 Tax=Athalassotoga saccharophila TaxID=1441386 RepID=UPI001379EF0A|nr:acyl carrier protein [Athalassotoga saccharophila]BBJ28771.1 acyl carrier protein [Athalassotoga saccharophila]